MLGRLVLIFILVPLIDLIVLLRIGEVLGFWPTLALVLLMGMLGAALARHQGLQTLARINAEIAAGRLPTTPLADGALILLAAALLVTPGFLTDVLGVALLLPPVRRLFRAGLTRWFQRQIVVTGFSPPGDSISNDTAPGNAGFDVPTAPRPVKYVKNEATRK
jgi:UPF0716 protein FxsA